MSEPNSSPPPEGQFLVYQAEDGKLKLEVRFEGETVWLTQQHMAELFQTTQQNISLHLQNIYSESELDRQATHKESLSVRREGTRSVQRRVDKGGSPSGPKIHAQRAVSSNPKSVPLFTLHSPPATRNCITP
jgi:hypothetical protein